MPSHLEPAERASESGMAFAELVLEEALRIIEQHPDEAETAAEQALEFTWAEGERRRGPWGSLERLAHILVARASLRRGDLARARSQARRPRRWATTVHGATTEARAHYVLAELALARSQVGEALGHLRMGGDLIARSDASDARIAEAYWEIGRFESFLDPEKAVLDLEAALRFLPPGCYDRLRLRATHQLALALVRLRDHDRAASLLDEAGLLWEVTSGKPLMITAECGWTRGAAVTVGHGGNGDVRRSGHELLTVDRTGSEEKGSRTQGP